MNVEVSEQFALLDNDEYHYGEELADHISSTRAKEAYKSPAQFGRKYYPVGPQKVLAEEDSDSDAMLFGTLVHDRCLIRKKGWKGHDGKRKQGEDVLYVSRRLKSSGSICQRDLIGCSLSLREALRYVFAMYSGGNWLAERVCTTTFTTGDGVEDFEFPVKAKFDLLLLHGNKAHLYDVKTTRNAEEWAFLRQADDLNYKFSLRWYSRVLEEIGYEVVEANWIAVEKGSPWRWDIYPCDESELAQADIEIDQALLNIGYGQKYGFPQSMKITEA